MSAHLVLRGSLRLSGRELEQGLTPIRGHGHITCEACMCSDGHFVEAVAIGKLH